MRATPPPQRPPPPAARALACAALLAAGCGGGADPARPCGADEDCGPPGAARCVQSTCVANGPPAVALSPPAGALLTNTLVRFGAVVVEPEGEPVDVAWSVTLLSGDCPGDADAVAGGADVVFWCAGTYEVAAAASDPWGHASVGRVRVTVAQASGAPVVTAGAPLSVDHACGGGPLRCSAVGPAGATAFQLGASASGGAVAWEWTALPPAGAERAVAALSPSGSIPNPTVSITSPGTPLAGAWRLRVRGRDAAGLLGQDVQVITVGNRPPAVADPELALDHVYAGGVYVLDADVAPALSDPDGDPVGATFALADAGPGCTGTIASTTAAAAHLTVSCADPQALAAGGRAVDVAADDGNGGIARTRVPLRALNRPPVLSLAGGAPLPATWAVDHAVGPCALPTAAGVDTCYLATAAPALGAVDPDGDPLPGYDLEARVDPSLAHTYGRTWRDAAGAPRFEFGTPLGLPDEFRTASGATGLSVRARVVDPFGAEASAGFALVVRNRPPQIALVDPLSAPHRYDAVAHAYLAAALAATVSDPDGDPVATSFTGDAVCADAVDLGGSLRVECSLPYTPAPGSPPPLAALATTHPLWFAATDGWEAASRSGVLAVENGAPQAPDATTVEACACVCVQPDPNYPTRCLDAEWQAAGSVTLTVPIGDADGDPALVGARDVCLPPGCAVAVVFPPASGSVTISDGVASAALRVDAVCAEAGTPCAY